MAYIEVTISPTGKGMVATSANGKSLGSNSGCLVLFLGNQYPIATDYLAALEDEGWVLVSTRSDTSVAGFDGIVMGSTTGVYTFQGGGRYEVIWEDGRWRLKEFGDTENDQDSSRLLSQQEYGVRFRMQRNKFIYEHGGKLKDVWGNDYTKAEVEGSGPKSLGGSWYEVDPGEDESYDEDPLEYY